VLETEKYSGTVLYKSHFESRCNVAGQAQVGLCVFKACHWNHW